MHTIKITPNLLFEYQCTSGKFIRLPNRIESKNRFGSENQIESNRNFFCPNWNVLLPTSGPLIGSNVVSPSATVRDLGVFIDQDLAMKTHVQQTASRCFATLRQLRSISRCIPTSVFHSLVSALDRPQQIGLLQQSPDRLASLSHPASPVSPKCRSKAHFNLRRCDHITDALISLHWHRVPEQITFKVATLTYRALHGSAPPYLASSLVIHMCRRHAAPTQAQVRLH